MSVAPAALNPFSRDSSSNEVLYTLPMWMDKGMIKATLAHAQFVPRRLNVNLSRKVLGEIYAWKQMSTSPFAYRSDVGWRVQADQLWDYHFDDHFKVYMAKHGGFL